jgi:hypothetical protein
MRTPRSYDSNLHATASAAPGSAARAQVWRGFFNDFDEIDPTRREPPSRAVRAPDDEPDR